MIGLARSIIDLIGEMAAMMIASTGLGKPMDGPIGGMGA